MPVVHDTPPPNGDRPFAEQPRDWQIATKAIGVVGFVRCTPPGHPQAAGLTLPELIAHYTYWHAASLDADAQDQVRRLAAEKLAAEGLNPPGDVTAETFRTTANPN